MKRHSWEKSYHNTVLISVDMNNYHTISKLILYLTSKQNQNITNDINHSCVTSLYLLLNVQGTNRKTMVMIYVLFPAICCCVCSLGVYGRLPT